MVDGSGEDVQPLITSPLLSLSSPNFPDDHSISAKKFHERPLLSRDFPRLPPL
jgi:hypothetical protein